MEEFFHFYFKLIKEHLNIQIVAILFISFCIFTAISAGIAWYNRVFKGRRTRNKDIKKWSSTSSSDNILDDTKKTDENKESNILNQSFELKEENDLLKNLDIVQQFWNSTSKDVQLPESDYYLASCKFVQKFRNNKDEFDNFFNNPSNIEWIMLKANDVLYQAGDTSDDGIYIVAEGILGLYHQDKLLSIYQQSDIFGYLSMILNKNRSRTIRARTNCKLICISKKIFLKANTDLQISFIETTIASQFRISQFIIQDFFKIKLIDKHLEYYQNYYQNNMNFLNELKSRKESIKLYSANSLLIESGQSNIDEFYIILSGKVAIETIDTIDNNPNYEIIQASIGTVIGLLSLLMGTSTHIKVTSLTQVKVACIKRQELQSKLLHNELLQLCYHCVKTISPILQEFDTLGFMKSWHRAGDILYEKGSKAKYIYIIVSGRVCLNKDSINHNQDQNYQLDNTLTHIKDGIFPSHNKLKENILYECGRNECFGDVSFLLSNETNQKHTCTSICVRDSEIIRISRNSFHILTNKYPYIYQIFTKILAKRLYYMSSKVNISSYNTKFSSKYNPNSINITIVPYNTKVNIKNFITKLSTSLATYGLTKIINQSLYKKLHGNDAYDHLHSYYYQSRLAFWITEMEQVYKFLIFETNANHSQWSKACIRAADIIFLVANANENAMIMKHEKELFQWNNTDPYNFFTYKELILIHDDHTKLPQHTAKWFKSPRTFDFFHHIKENNVLHYQRLSRYLSGNLIGLVLSGGGSRGLAHYSVFKTLYEQQISIDCIAGSSQGAFMAAIYAMNPIENDLDLKRIKKKSLALANAMGNLKNLLKDITIPLMSYFSGKKFSQGICEILKLNSNRKQIQIEDCWIPFFCISTNVYTCDQLIHRCGTLWQAVRASMSILEYLPPMSIKNIGLLIDGGYVSNLPVDILKDYYKPKYVIAIDVENKNNYSKTFTYYGSYLTGSWLLYKKFLSFIPGISEINIPKFSEIIYNLLYINHNRNIRSAIKTNKIDLYLRPPLGKIQLLDYHLFDKISQITYLYLQDLVKQWKQDQQD